MIYGLYQSAAGMMVSEYRQSVIANNLANADTVGFKRDVATFAERDPARLAGVRRGVGDRLLEALSGGVWLGRTETDLSQGSLTATQNPTDVALDGPGFFLVEKGGRRYATRDGRMRVDPQGALISATDGAAMLGPGGVPLRVDPRGGAITVDEGGRIRQDGRIVGQLAVVDYADPRRLRKAGGGRFETEGLQPIESPARVVQGYTESSGVEAVQELVSMIEVSRAYQMNAALLALQDQTVGRLISSLAGM